MTVMSFNFISLIKTVLVERFHYLCGFDFIVHSDQDELLGVVDDVVPGDLLVDPGVLRGWNF